MEYLHEFETQAQCTAFVNSADYKEPFTALVDEISGVSYNKSEQHDYRQDYLTFKISSPGTINWKASDTSITKTIEYKLNDGEWVSITSNTGASAPTINVIEGDEIQFRGDNATYGGNYQYTTFRDSTAGFEVEGNIMSLIDSTGFTTATTLASICYHSMFQGCTGLTSAENLILPATTLGDSCYGNMFGGCTSLTTAPELPATTLANSCYNSMFYCCTSLTTAPSVLPATTLETYCYNQMFAHCTSLTTAPELPATTLADYCYDGMFYDCTSLTTAPSILPATTLANYCYGEMFYGCTSLTTAPELPATTLTNQCYFKMFYGCNSLNYIKCLATDISATECTDYWVGSMGSGSGSGGGGVSPTGTFVKAANMNDWTYGGGGIPEEWTVVDAS